MQVKDAIANRLSIRRYARQSIPPEQMRIMFHALQLAPSANNYQNWEFVFVSDGDLKRQLIKACSHQRFVKDCTYFIAGIADPALKWHMVDITIALTNFTLQATALGYGTCWIGAFDEHQIKDILKIPAEKKVVICMTFGVPEGKHIARARKPLEDFIYANGYGRPFGQGR
jgi:nitroreductase